jgi:YqaJ-like viral recombinase domain
MIVETPTEFPRVRLGPTNAYMMPQYSAEYWQLRRGVPTASEANKILTAKTGKLSSSADEYINQLIADRVFFSPDFTTNRPMSREMAEGLDMEPYARNWYAMENPKSKVTEVGFCLTDDDRFGCSPDGLVDDDGAIELKAPALKTHVGYLRYHNELLNDYKGQVHMQLIVTGRSWVDLISYVPSLPPLVIRVVPDEYTDKLRDALDQFWDNYQAACRLVIPHLMPTIAETPDGYIPGRSTIRE